LECLHWVLSGGVVDSHVKPVDPASENRYSLSATSFFTHPSLVSVTLWDICDSYDVWMS
jgi:hypothetical protein